MQGGHAWFNHNAFHRFLLQFFYGRSGIARAYPNHFGPLFPIPAMALGAAMVCMVPYSVALN